MNDRVLRVFPSRNKATPDDNLTWIGDPPMTLDLFPPFDEVHISVTFTWDIQEGRRLFRAWSDRADDVQIGGAALGDSGGEFVPGRYLKPGYVITSRGCPFRCPHCFVPGREGKIRELPITEGWNVLDNNLLACSQKHIEAVFDMLRKQKERIEFTGGLDSRLLKTWHIDLLKSIHIGQLFFAYDNPAQLVYLQEAGKMLSRAGIRKKRLRCFVLAGYEGDSPGKAEKRGIEAWRAGFYPFMMYYRDGGDAVALTGEWPETIRNWCRPAIIYSRMKRVC